VTKKIWVPDAVFASRTRPLSTLEVGDQIFVNAYLLGTITFGLKGLDIEAAVAAEFMGVEAVHRALARQSLGKLGNDRVFMKLDDKEGAPDAPNWGQAASSTSGPPSRRCRPQAWLRRARQGQGPVLRVRHGEQAHAEREGQGPAGTQPVRARHVQPLASAHRIRRQARMPRRTDAVRPRT
jgi:hypothetical protein